LLGGWFFSVASVSVWASQPAPDPPPSPNPPAEETRLNTVRFREALKKRGLNEILDLHFRDFPPTNAATTLLLIRELRLAEFADISRSAHHRQASIAEANRILDQLVVDNPEDPRRFRWQYTLAHSLLYEEAEPFTTNILYFGGSEDDRKRLTVLASRAVESIRSLIQRLREESARIDQLPSQEFEAIERKGHVDELDRLSLSADYLLLWAMFYDALPRTADDAMKARQLSGILEEFAAKPTILETPHELSHVQVQARLLAGMTYRRLNDHSAAREQLDRTAGIAARLTDVVEKERVQWAVTLAAIEAIRNDRDDGRFDDALSAAARLRGAAGVGSGDRFGLRLAAAMLEKSIHEARAAVAEKAGRPVEVNELRTLAWKSLVQLAAEEPDRRDAIYAALYRTMGRDANVDRLDPLEQCAYVAGLISEAGSAQEEAPMLLDRAIAAGERFFSQSRTKDKPLTPEMLYQLALAHFRRGDRLAAARRFVEAADYEPKFDRGLNCATLAVQLAAELYHDDHEPRTDEVTALYRKSLEVLLANHAGTEAGRYWRFYYAQLLDELEDFDLAAEQFRLVDAAQDRFLESGFFRVRALAAALHRAAAGSGGEALDLVLRTDALFSANRDFITRVGGSMGREPQSPFEKSPRRLLAEARVLAAEAAVIPRVDRAAQALELLSNFERDYAEVSVLFGRVWRIRLLAYEALGRLEEAERAIPEFCAAARDDAPPTLRGLFTAMSGDVDRLRVAGDEASAQRKAEVALMLAEQLNSWADANDSALAGVERRESRLRLAEANMQAGRYEKALAMFDELAVAIDSTALPTGETDIRIAVGQAEALYGMGRFAEALPKFNRLATGLTPNHPIRWKSLLRDLECRTALREPAAGILKVIEQQRYLHPDLGGAAMTVDFERVRRENERRSGSE